MSDPDQIRIFDRALLRARRNRAAAGFAAHDVLFRESASHLVERLADIKQQFPSILDLGAHTGYLAHQLADRGTVVSADMSEDMVCRAPGLKLVADEEFLPFAPASFDLIVSNLSLHWVNDLPGALVQIKTALKPGGLFLAALIGGESLFELRSCLMDAELAVSGGISPRLSPTIDMPTASALLQRTGFSMPVTDNEKITLAYTDAHALMRDLRGMGETGVHRQRLRRFTRRKIYSETARLYNERFANIENEVAATFELIFLHGVKAGH